MPGLFKGFRNGMTDEELKELFGGTDPKDIGNQLKKLETLTTEFSTVKEKLNSLDAIQTSLTALTEKLNTQTPPNNNNDNNNNDDNRNNNNNNNDNIELNFLAEPEDSVKRLIAAETGPMKAATAAIYGEMNYNTFKASNPRGWDKLEKYIRPEWEKQPVQNRMHPDLVKNLYKIALADHIDEIAKDNTTFFVETGGGSRAGATDNNNGGTKKPEELMSKDELKQAEIWGLTPQEWVDQKAKLHYV